MPYTIKTDGMEELNQILKSLDEQAGDIAAKGLYQGAGMMADTLEAQAKAIRTAPFKWASKSRGATRLLSPEEKAVVLAADGVGIAKFNKNGSEVDTSVGYSNSGYAVMLGKVVPIPKIANAINSGTSFLQKQPFIRKAKNSGGKKAMEAVVKSIKESVEEITGGKNK